MEIIPAILTDDAQELDSLLRQIRDSGKFARVQIDFVDEEYAANGSIRVEECKGIRDYPEIKFDAHLMVTENNIGVWSKMAEKFGFDRIIAQIEKISHPENFSALALDLDTDVSCIDASMHRTLGLVLLMAVKAGSGGQEFDKSVLSKINKLSNLRKIGGYKYRICVDGGVEKEHLPQLEKLGVDEVAVGARRVLQW